MAHNGPRSRRIGRTRHAARRIGTALYAPPHVGQRRSMLREVQYSASRVVISVALIALALLQSMDSLFIYLFFFRSFNAPFSCPPRTFLPALCRIL